MKRSRSYRGRQRITRGLLEVPSGRPLVEAVDHGPDVRLDAGVVGCVGDRWIEPFLEANARYLRRLNISAAVDTRGGALRLTPGCRIGAVPLLSPSTRRVAAGLLVKPRFRWAALGAVLGDIGFAIEPSLGGTPLVPGSAREVPPWILAAPVIRRLEAFLRRRKRGFTVRQEVRNSPRGRVDWSHWARAHVPAGRWTTLPCQFSEPDDDPTLMAAVRWTLGRLDDELAIFQDSLPARLLRSRIADLLIQVGSGAVRRPNGDVQVASGGWVNDAIQAMGWVADERGLGGSRVLDGMSWDLPVDEIWEAWVGSFVAELAPRCGLTVRGRGETARPLNWTTSIASMRMLIPDSGLRGSERVVWVDAKYKAHLQLLASQGWSGLDEAVRESHRADLHQALAYAALEDVQQVDSLLVYPDLTAGQRSCPAIATVASGRRRVRLLLVGLPFGFRSFEQREAKLAEWRDFLSA